MSSKSILPISSKIFSKLEQIEKRYAALRFEVVSQISMQFCELKDQHYRQAPIGVEGISFSDIAPGTKWGGDWITAWFIGSVKLPEICHGKKTFLRAGTGAESLFIVNNEYKGVFDENHPVVLLDICGDAGKAYEIAMEAYSGHFHPGCMPTDLPITPEKGCKIFNGTQLLLEREDVSEFVFDFMALRSLLSAMDKNTLRRNVILRELVKVYDIVDMYPEESGEASWRPKLAEAQKIIKPLLAQKNGPTIPYMGIIGHSHMDTAWLWPLRETWRKCARTFSSILNLMDQYPEFTFIQSSPAQTEQIKNLYPSIFEGIQKRVAEGRYEPNGGMWVEPDCNIPSGESLVRQVLVAQKYTREWFGYTADTLWMPDVFGYSATLPQILKGGKIDYFCTTKISWNDTTRHPYDTFTWKGIDGSSVISHFNQIHCWPDPATFTHAWNWVQHKDNQDRRLISYGFGDGGGGPMAEMIEVSRRSADLEGSPKSSHTTVKQFMDSIRDGENILPVWAGELYLEAHRGTLTSIGAIKKSNRACEFALRDAEIACTISALMGNDYPKSELLRIWKDLLVNQFHDILPGSSIAEVNDLAIETFAKAIKDANDIKDKAFKSAIADAEDKKYLLINTLSWDRCGNIAVKDICDTNLVPCCDSIKSQWVKDIEGNNKLILNGITLPALGSKTIEFKVCDGQKSESPFIYNGCCLETPFASLRFDGKGRIISFFDKNVKRDIVAAGGVLNGFLIGEDVPESWDNWDIDQDQKDKMKDDFQLISREVIFDGELELIVQSKFELGAHSFITQNMIFHSDSPQVDFETKLDWSEKHKLFKTGFDLNLLADFSRSEIQYGYAERPTHTNQIDDVARFEVCNHKWSDLSENGFGVSVLNDCKYGISINESSMALTLIKSGTHPDPRGDEGIHIFTYSLLPHNCGFNAVSVVRPAYELNLPVTVYKSAACECGSLVTVDKSNVIIEAVKQSEEGSDIIIRLYEAEKTGTSVNLKFGFDVKEVFETNLLEEEIGNIVVNDNTVDIDMRAFEIKTLRLKL